ncbi:MAG: radical SAM protein [Bacteroidetes bacterium]|nr:radical SAM protein [Bacteroidota bacterium]
MKKLLLVNTNAEKSPYPIPPLGICLIASFLNGHYDVKIYDGMFDEGRSLGSVIHSYNPDFIGFSIRNVDEVVPERSTFFIQGVYRNFIEPARKFTTAPFILGGSGYTIFPREILDYTGADYGIAGEGEEPLLILLQKLERGETVTRIPNVYARKGEGPRKLRAEGDYNLRPYSEIDLKLDFNPYTDRGVYSIQTKRGCALRCLYCSYPLLEGRQYRLRAPQAIVNEIEEASERLGESVTFEFVDSTFNEPKGHAEEICKELIRRKIRVRLRTMGVNPRNTSKELFGLMTEAGFAQIDVTPDSASVTVIKNLLKGFTIDDIRRTAMLIREFNFPSMWFFLFGGPGENRGTFNETLNFIDNFINPNDLVYMSGGLRIYPGTPLFDVALKEGFISDSDNLFKPSVFYFSKESPQAVLRDWITEACRDRLNCLPSYETNAPAEMLREAVSTRSNQGLTEPMFRTLLRLRREWKISGKL